MFQSIFLRKYFRSPFLIWGLAVFFFTTFDSWVLSYQIMGTILLLNLYIPILFGSMTIAIIFSTVPVRQGLKDLARKKENKLFAILSAILLLLVPFADALFFLSDPFVILGTFQPQIMDKKTFDDIALTKTLAQFIGMPLFAAYVLTTVKNKLVKEDLEINGKFKDNLRFVAEIVIINASMYGVYLLITNHLL